MSEPRALFLHGAGGGGWEWRIWCAVWSARGWHVRAPDLMPVAAEPASTRWSDYLSQVEQAVEDARPACIVGASLGGLLALAVASHARGLVLINPLPPAPWHAQLPPRAWPPRVEWRRQARLDSTRRAASDADEASMLHAFRHWRDESGDVLRTASAGVALPSPPHRCLVIASDDDRDVPAQASRAMANSWNADWLGVRGGHLSPLMGPLAAGIAAQAVEWMNTHEHAS